MRFPAFFTLFAPTPSTAEPAEPAEPAAPVVAEVAEPVAPVAAEVAEPAAGSAGPPVESRIPRYPPFLEGIPACRVADLLATQDGLLQTLHETLPPEARPVITPVLARYAAWVHLLPASEAHHHRGAGGLLRHGLEVALQAARAAQGRLYAYGSEPPARRQTLEPRFQVAAALAGLCHDLGKPCTDLSVHSRDGRFTWNPWLMPLADWLQTAALDGYFLTWRAGRHGDHRYATPVAAAQVLTPAGLAWLADPVAGSATLVTDLLTALGDPDAAGVLGEVVVAADRFSVEQDLRDAPLQAAQVGLGIPLEQYVLDALRRLRDGWTVNAPGARLWVLGDGLYIVWRPAAQEVVSLLMTDGLPGIPRDPDTLADILLERGLAQARVLADGRRYRYWLIAPAALPDACLYTLRLDPALVFTTPPPPVAAQVLEAAPTATRPASTAAGDARPAASPSVFMSLDSTTRPPEAQAAAAASTLREESGAEDDLESAFRSVRLPVDDGDSGGGRPPATPSVPAAATARAAGGDAPAAEAALAADFVALLAAAARAGRLPFPVDARTDGLAVPRQAALRWYLETPGALPCPEGTVGLLKALRSPAAATGAPWVELIEVKQSLTPPGLLIKLGAAGLTVATPPAAGGAAGGAAGAAAAPLAADFVARVRDGWREHQLPFPVEEAEGGLLFEPRPALAWYRTQSGAPPCNGITHLLSALREPGPQGAAWGTQVERAAGHASRFLLRIPTA